MKIFLNSRIALFYPGKFTGMQKLEKLASTLRIELRIVQSEALTLTVAALAGFANAPVPEKEFAGKVPDKSCILFSGLTEEKLNKAIDRLSGEDLSVDYKAVLTGENRNWAFGTLMQELEKEAAEKDAAADVAKE